MSDSVRDSIYNAIASIRLVDPHTHINPHAPASGTLADLLGYHYYTELAHSAGLPKDQIEQDGLTPRELVGRLVGNLTPIENTAQYRWLVEICRKFFGFEGDRIDLSNWEEVYDSAEQKMSQAEWPQLVLDQSNVEAVFLTNDFDDDLEGFDTDTYIPCLRTDDLVFHLAKPETQQRLASSSGIELDGSLYRLRESLKQRFEHFVSHGARACAISLPPSFEPAMVSDGRSATALNEVLRRGTLADASHQAALSRRVFWTLAELCDEFGLPFDLMIGVNRGVYTGGVFQGQDLYDSRVSLIQYRALFNAFPAVKFPISVLASVTNQELVSYAWIFPNVITNGHWWYSNTPSFIARDAAARLEAVPKTKQIAYYSDAYKLEFVWPKFDMYRRILANLLTDHFVIGNGWDEERAIELGRQVLRDNVDEIFPPPSEMVSEPIDPHAETENEHHDLERDPHGTWQDAAVAGTSTSLASGAIGTVEVADDNDDADPEKTWVEEGDAAGAEDAAGGEAMPTDAEEDELVDYSTTLDMHDTSNDVDSASKQDGPLDPLPSAEEIQAVDVQDVQLTDTQKDRTASESSDMDDEPLDVGDLSGDDETATKPTEIHMLRGEDSFELDEDSLQLKPHPLTGELTLPISSDDDPQMPSELLLDGGESTPENPSSANDLGATTDDANTNDATTDDATTDDANTNDQDDSSDPPAASKT